MINIIKKYLSSIIIFVLCILVMVLTMKGHLGNPDENILIEKYWSENGPFELSPDRGRFALLYSMVENKSLHFSIPIARFVAPDVAYFNNSYVSLFAPTLSFILIPGYVIGKILGASQIGTFAVISIFAILNVFLIRKIASSLGAKDIYATLGGLIFLFATPAFAYSVSLYQHHVTTFLILLSIYILLKFNSIAAAAAVWGLTAISISLDNPNAIFMLPIALYAGFRLIEFRKLRKVYKIKFKVLGVFAVFFALLPIVPFLIYNDIVNGSPLQLSGTLPGVQVISQSGEAFTKAEDGSLIPLSDSKRQEENLNKSTSGFFRARNLVNGIYTQTVSPDRGTLFFAPVMLFAFIPVYFKSKIGKNIKSLMIAVAGFIVLLYSLWGDPWGGWAFGSRYLIPAYAIGAIFVSLALKKIFSKRIFGLLFIVILAFSITVNTLGAITTNRNPPEVEAVPLQEITKQIENYSFDRNWSYLVGGNSKSVFFDESAHKYLTSVEYFLVVLTIVETIVLMPALYILINNKEKSI